jgi:hypothetical protein
VEGNEASCDGQQYRKPTRGKESGEISRTNSGGAGTSNMTQQKTVLTQAYKRQKTCDWRSTSEGVGQRPKARWKAGVPVGSQRAGGRQQLSYLRDGRRPIKVGILVKIY